MLLNTEVSFFNNLSSALGLFWSWGNTHSSYAEALFTGLNVVIHQHCLQFLKRDFVPFKTISSDTHNLNFLIAEFQSHRAAHSSNLIKTTSDTYSSYS